MTRAFALALLLLAACSREAEAPPSNQAGEPVPAAAQEVPTPSLAGTWRVTAFNGAPLTQVFDMNATFADDRLTIASDCVRMAWTYTQNRNVVTFEPAAGTACERGRTNSEDQVEKALGLANMALFSDDGREVQLSGSGGTVTLVRR